MVTHLLYNGSGHYKIASFNSTASHEILFWVIVNGSGSSWESLLYFWVNVGYREFIGILDQQISSYDVTV